MRPSVVVHPRGAERVRRGHPWIYRSDLVEVDAQGGDVVEVRVGRRKIGEALYSDRSLIALRLLVRGGRRVDADLLRERLEGALALRERLKIGSTAYRLVHGEGDLLPSLIVDRYGDVLVAQALSQGMDRLLPQIVEMLERRLAPSGILARNDARSRSLEGLEQKTEVLSGTVPDRISVREGEVETEVDPRGGQKTGLFLDQRENRAVAGAYARGRSLDCFSYEGGFALHLAPRSSEVVAVELSAEAAGHIARNADRNRVSNLRIEIANAFDFLREADRTEERFDTIVLDPPAFAKSRAALGRALGGYKEINLRALKILSSGGILFSCSCSHHVSERALLEVVEAAAVDAHATVSLLEKRMQSRDHPVLLGVPETSYLKCLILRKL